MLVFLLLPFLVFFFYSSSFSACSCFLLVTHLFLLVSVFLFSFFLFPLVPFITSTFISILTYEYMEHQQQHPLLLPSSLPSPPSLLPEHTGSGSFHRCGFNPCPSFQWCQNACESAARSSLRRNGTRWRLAFFISSPHSKMTGRLFSIARLFFSSFRESREAFLFGCVSVTAVLLGVCMFVLHFLRP